MYRLFACELMTVWPSITMSFCGLPLAKMARPSVHFWVADALHSIRWVGFDMGNIIGRSLISPIAVNTSEVKIGPAPLRPSSAVGLTCNRRQKALGRCGQSP